MIPQSSEGAFVWSELLPVLAGIWKKKIGPRRGNGDRWIMIAHAFLCWQRRLWSPWHAFFLHFLPPNSLHFLPPFWLVPVKSDIPLWPSKNNQHSATLQPAVRGVHRLTTGVHAEVIRSCQTWSVLCYDWEVRALRFASPASQLWLQCRCTNGLFINVDH